MATAYFRFYEELNDFLPPGRRKVEFRHDFDRRASIKDMIESFGVPHPEIDLILVNGESVDFSHIVADGDRISVYPVFERRELYRKLNPSAAARVATRARRRRLSARHRLDYHRRMNETDSRLPGVFFAAIEQELQAHPDGIAEYALIRALKDRGFLEFLPPPPAEPHELFRAHFLLFHALYRLRDRLAANRRGLLRISALCIRIMPWAAGDDALAVPDPLRAYYLDWNNLDGTSETDVAELLASFWKKLGGIDNREQALAELGLADPVDDATIKRTWRKLAMEHHPDRGGDKERLQAINAAVDCLIG